MDFGDSPAKFRRNSEESVAGNISADFKNIFHFYGVAQKEEVEAGGGENKQSTNLAFLLATMRHRRRLQNDS